MGSRISRRSKEKHKKRNSDGAAAATGCTSGVKSPSGEEPSTSDIVEEAWKVIETQETIRSKDEEAPGNDVAWTPIRVFVSSTFSDMHSEREVLVKKIFPELREWCEEKRFTLTECDMRWGIPKDATGSATISVCLEEIDRCLEENGGAPFFVGMLSERYGWIPSGSEVTEEIKKKYSWVGNVSITHMEILHGAYRSSNPNALFCIRDSKFVCDLPDPHAAKFVEADDLPKLHLKVLKEKLKKKFGDQCVAYECQVSGLDNSTGREKVKLVGLEGFGQKVLDFLKNAISKQYPRNNQNAALDEYELDDVAHKRTTALQSRSVVGRARHLKDLMEYAEGGSAGECFASRDGGGDDDDAEERRKYLQTECERYDVDTNGKKIVCIYGVPGAGKSSVLCKSAVALVERGVKVLLHYTGCTTLSCDWRSFARRVIKFCGGSLEGFDGQDSEGVEDEVLKKKMMEHLKSIPGRVVLVVCKLENMHDSDSVNCLSWLPPRFPENVGCIVSVDSNNVVCMDRMRRKDCRLVPMEDFSYEDASLFVREFFSRNNKELDEHQTKKLLANKSSTFPLWLKVACEELRVFGDFATLDAKIDSFPSDLKGLVGFVIGRLVMEDETLLMEKLLCLMLCTHSGLPEKEISKLLGEPDKGVESPSLVWATLRIHLKPFIMQTRFYKTTKVKLMHEAFNQAARELLLNDEKNKKWHTYLADYFEFHNEDEVYMHDDLAFNLINSADWSRMATFYKSNQRTFNMNALMRSRILSKIRCRQHVFAGRACKVVLCLHCSHKTRIVSVLPHSTKDVCSLCGSWVPFKTPKDAALLCMHHQTHFSEDFKKCFLCKNHVMDRDPTQMYLCNYCSMGGQSCSRLLDGPA